MSQLRNKFDTIFAQHSLPQVATPQLDFLPMEIPSSKTFDELHLEELFESVDETIFDMSANMPIISDEEASC
jgi:hypothetical protein